MKNKVVLIVAVLFGLLAAFLTRTYLTTKNDEFKRLTDRFNATHGTIDAICFNKDVPGGTVVARSDLGILTVPKAGLRGQALTEANLADIIGRKILIGHRKGDIIFWSDIEGGNPIAGGLAADIRRKMRAISINVSGAAAVSGMVKPNDHVDVIGTFTFPKPAPDGKNVIQELVTCTILQNVLVLATGKETAKSSAPLFGGGSYSTLATQPQRHVLRAGAAAGRLREDPRRDRGAERQAPDGDGRASLMAFSLDLIRPGEGTATRYTLQDGSYLIGRGSSCHVQLPYPEVSERHALLLLRGETSRLEDLHSANGTYINGIPVDGIVILHPDSVVQIGESMLRVAPIPAEEAIVPAPEAAPPPAASARVKPPTAARPDPAALQAAAIRRQVKEQIQQELIERLDLKRLTVSGVDRAGLEKKASEKIHEIVEQVRTNGKLPREIDAARLEREVFNEALRLGPLEDLLADETVTEIMVNGPRQIYVERHGKLLRSPLHSPRSTPLCSSRTRSKS